MNRDLTKQELDNEEVGNFFYACIKITEEWIKDGILKGCSLGCPAIDDEFMLPMANKMCGVKADFIYFYTVMGKPDNFFADRDTLKEFLNDALSLLKGKVINGAEVIESNVISNVISSKKKVGTEICCHFLCFLMKRKAVKYDA